MNAAVLAQKGEYNFAINGGAVSTINLGVIVPPQSFLSEIQLGVITSLNSGGAATIDFGYSQRGGGAAASTNAFTSSGAIGFASIASTGLAGYKISTTGFILIAYELTMTINVAALTAGRFIVIPVFSKVTY